MPGNVVKTPEEEKLWERAKSKVSRGWKGERDQKFWSTVNMVFQRMKTAKKKGS
jgi:hypothetical protein